MTSTMDWPEYIAQQIKTGVYAENSPFPENDPRVLREFLSLVKDGPAEITVLADRYGYFFDACDVGREGANVVGSSSLIDVNLGVGYADFVKDLPVICEQAAGRIRIITDTFSFADGYGDGNPALEGLHWLNSPVAAINMSWEAYLESLTTERRKKHRRSCADFEKTNLKFALSDQALTTAELDWVQTNLQRKWGDDADYAYRQTLWSHAVGKFRPNQNLTMRVTDADKLVFVQTMVVKGDAVYCQSIAKDEDRFYNGLAAFTRFRMY
jgi:hypothetical protein